MLRERKWLALALCVSLLFGSMPGVQCLLFAQEEAPPLLISKTKTFLEVGLEELSGTVFYSDLRTRVTGSPVRVWSRKDNKFVYETTTDEKGAYKIPVLPEGYYYVVFGDRLILEILVDASVRRVGRPHNVVVPRGKSGLTLEQLSRMLRPAEIEDNTGGATRNRQLLRSVIILGTATLIVGVILYRAWGHPGREKKIVSP